MSHKNDHVGADTQDEVSDIQRYTAALNAAIRRLGRPMTEEEEEAFQAAFQDDNQ